MCEQGARVTVVRNDHVDVAHCVGLKPDRVMISPGPGNPSEAGISNDVIKAFAGKVPIFGVCLGTWSMLLAHPCARVTTDHTLVLRTTSRARSRTGHQCMFEVFGGTVSHANEIMHGKVSNMTHDGKGIFAGLPTGGFEAVRYHSLVGLVSTLPACLEVTSTLEGRDMIMGVLHKEMKIEGVQFHPESVASQHGKTMIRNFLTM